MNSGAAQPIVQAVNAAASGAVAAVNSAASGAAAVVNSAASGAAAAVNSAATTVANAATNIAKNVPILNSLVPLGNAGKNMNKKNNTGVTPAPSPPPANNSSKKNNSGNAGLFENMGNMFENVMGPSEPAANNGSKKNNSGLMGAVNAGISAAAANFSVNKGVAAAANTGAASLMTPLGIFIGLTLTFLVIFAVFNKEIRQGYNYFAQSVKKAFGFSTVTDVVSETVPTRGDIQEITVPPQAPQDITPAQQELAQQTIVEKILPSAGTNEVFNVSQNKFTYYDAEPLCKALGAELATYEQVKDAWGKGADWCNYGWVKGQMAIYPTQKDTYDKLQTGPADEKNACGTVGVNGGFFDNPDMRFGVNCYGNKPSQSAHDEQKLMEQGKVPRSPATLKADQKIAEYKAEADSLFVKPFNDGKWSTL